MSYQSEVIADSPLIYFPYTDNTLTTNLGSKTGVTVASSGGVTFSNGIRDGRCLEFAGPTVASRVTYSMTNDMFNSTTWSIEVWFRIRAQDNHLDIINSEDTNNQIALFVWAPGGTSDSKTLKLFQKGSGGVRQQINGPVITDNVWHHAVVTRSVSALTLYCDGVSVGTPLTPQTNNFVSTTPVRLAAYGDAFPNENFNGWIDEVAIYPTALSSTRITTHYNEGTLATPYSTTVLADQPIGYWRMETATAFNTITSANNTLVGTPTVAVGKKSNGWTMNQNVSVNLGGTYQDFTSDGSFSIEAWFNMPVGATSSYPTIWRRDGNGIALLLRLRSPAFLSGNSPGKAEVYLNGTTFYSTVPYNDATWHHIVLTVGGSVAKIYIDGGLNNSVACGTGWNVTSASGSAALCAGGPDPSNDEGWAGSLDEIALYDYTMSATQVAAHYNAVDVIPFKGWGMPPR